MARRRPRAAGACPVGRPRPRQPAAQGPMQRRPARRSPANRHGTRASGGRGHHPCPAELPHHADRREAGANIRAQAENDRAVGDGGRRGAEVEHDHPHDHAGDGAAEQRQQAPSVAYHGQRGQQRAARPAAVGEPTDETRAQGGGCADQREPAHAAAAPAERGALHVKGNPDPECGEPPRVFRRPHLLREWGHDEEESSSFSG